MTDPTKFSLPAIMPSQPWPCKICGTMAQVCGWLDFNRHCSADGKYKLLPSNIPIPYNLCPNCRFLFSCAFDEWTDDDFKHFIYNDEYALIDPEFESSRPRSNLTWFENLFGNARWIRILDYGGGNGETVKLAREAGFPNCSIYDPFVSEFSKLPSGTFDLVTCFEAIEHSPKPMETIEELTRLAGGRGLVLFSTLLVPENIETIGLNWWYAAPRNSHISMHSEKSIVLVFEKFGFKVAFFDHNKFIAFRKIPDFAHHIFSSLQTSAIT